MRFTPHLLFFPAATLYGALLLPWSVGAMLHAVAAPASLATAFGHAHEMLAGYALAVVAGRLGAVVRTEGKDISWYGSRAVTGIPRLRAVIDRYRVVS